MNNNLEIKIAHLYPQLMNICGDSANISALKRRLEARNIRALVTNISIGCDIDYENFDIYFIGGGQDKAKHAVSNELLQHKTKLKALADNGTVMLSVCGGYQLFGKYYEYPDGEKLQGIGLLNAYTIRGKNRNIGNVTVETDFLRENTLVGFENHRGLTYLENDTKPLGKVVIGNGNNLTDKTEGARYNNVFGTYLHGPILPKNPAFCDYLLQITIRQKLGDKNFVLSPIDDTLENLAHKNLIKKEY